jgi:hypothetical protein
MCAFATQLRGRESMAPLRFSILNLRSSILASSLLRLGKGLGIDFVKNLEIGDLHVDKFLAVAGNPRPSIKVLLARRMARRVQAGD